MPTTSISGVASLADFVWMISRPRTHTAITVNIAPPRSSGTNPPDKSFIPLAARKMRSMKSSGETTSTVFHTGHLNTPETTK